MNYIIAQARQRSCYNRAMRMRLAALGVLLALFAAACGGGGEIGPPPGGEISIDGYYAGIATASSSGAEITIEIELATFNGQLEVALRYPENEQVEPLFGIGSHWGRSFALVLNERTGRESYFEGFISEDGRELTATLHYPDSAETFTIWALLV